MLIGPLLFILIPTSFLLIPAVRSPDIHPRNVLFWVFFLGGGYIGNFIWVEKNKKKGEEYKGRNMR